MKTKFIFFILGILFTISAFSQSKTYFTSGGETIFSFANIQDNGNSESSIMRWAPAFNIQSMVNLDMNQHVGIFSGFAVRNVGYIYNNYKMAGQGEQPDYTVKKKFRSYDFGIPVGFKLGNLDKMFFYAGYEVEIPFLYKEKTFDGNDKISKTTGWFSDRQELLQHGFFAGIQFPYGLNLKFKYYMSEFHNQDYVDSQGNKPYAGLNSHVFYFSLSTFLFKNLDFDANLPSK
jgi:hypothetical protein